jgi:hypothetical protein
MLHFSWWLRSNYVFASWIKALGSWRPKPQFVCKVLGPSTPHAVGCFKTASSQFFNLSLALQAIQDQFGLFWLFNLTNLGAIVIVLLASLPISGINLIYYVAWENSSVTAWTMNCCDKHCHCIMICVNLIDVLQLQTVSWSYVLLTQLKFEDFI